MSGEQVMLDDGRPTMSTAEAAAYIGCQASSLRWGRSKGWGPAFYRGLGKEVRYRKRDLDEFIASRRIDPQER